MTAWIEDWFGSDYYSLLYKRRGFSEAHSFLDNLIGFLKIPFNSKILDCGCGKGRHSVYLREKGFKVTGLDISERNIIESKKNENENLDFFVHDMRNLFRINYYDVALSLFTSFGYFEKDSENNKVIKSIASSLKSKGLFVLDFMNAEKELNGLVAEEKSQINGIDFNLLRYAKDNCIVKEIVVSDKGKQYAFRENVKAYKAADLEIFFTQNQLEVVHLFGDYQLTTFNVATSDRLIIIGRKKIIHG